MFETLSDYPAEEQAFLQQMHDRPDDEFLPLVYADWLDDQGDPRGPILRLISDRGKLSHFHDDNRLLISRINTEINQCIDAEDDWQIVIWLEQIESLFLRRAKVRNCGIPMAEPPEHPIVRFQFQCPNQWSSLEVMDQKQVRFCGDCRQSVYYCDSMNEVEAHAHQGHCIAISLNVRLQAEKEIVAPLELARGMLIEETAEDIFHRGWAEEIFSNHYRNRSRKKKR